jgi:hypothetical protein
MVPPWPWSARWSRSGMGLAGRRRPLLRPAPRDGYRMGTSLQIPFQVGSRTCCSRHTKAIRVPSTVPGYARRAHHGRRRSPLRLFARRFSAHGTDLVAFQIKSAPKLRHKAPGALRSMLSAASDRPGEARPAPAGGRSGDPEARALIGRLELPVGTGGLSRYGGGRSREPDLAGQTSFPPCSGCERGTVSGGDRPHDGEAQTVDICQIGTRGRARTLWCP